MISKMEVWEISRRLLSLNSEFLGAPTIVFNQRILLIFTNITSEKKTTKYKLWDF